MDHFPTEIAGLAPARATPTIDLEDGERLGLRITPVAKQIGDAVVRMLAYNGSVPGPTLRVRQGSELVVQVLNEGDLETTVHWHGLRLENRFDGTHETQRSIPVGGEFTYRLRFADPGVYWYHPHIREDYAQELGLYGNIVVAPADPDHWPPVHREVALALDDILLEDGKVAPFRRSEVTHSAMGRFGNVLLVNGDPALSLSARRGEVVRFFLTNTANTRVFNLGLRGARLKLVGGDSGHREREEFVESVLLGPSERAVVDVLFEVPGPCVLEHRTPNRTHTLATIAVNEERAEPPLAAGYERLRTLTDLTAERERIARFLHAEPDKTLALVATMDLGAPEMAPGTPIAYACPMHPEVVSEEPGRCPKCGMKLVPAHLVREAAGGEHGHAHHSMEPPPASPEQEGHRHHPAIMQSAALGGDASENLPHGIEWEDDMVDVNRMTTPANTRWKLVDRATGAEGRAIAWRFRVGDRVKIRLINEMDSDHPMHHPFHIHGAGRFLVLSRDGIPQPNLGWKDTVLLPTGQTVDILLEVTNPGRWMAHCHIAEHHESGMMFSFDVED